MHANLMLDEKCVLMTAYIEKGEIPKTMKTNIHKTLVRTAF